MASTVSYGNDRSEKWQRPFQMATTVYEREIGLADHLKRDNKGRFYCSKALKRNHDNSSRLRSCCFGTFPSPSAENDHCPIAVHL